MQNPLVTVIIPLYNKEKFVSRAISSVLSQTMENFELLIINDGSTDNSYEIVKNYLSDKRIRVLTQENKGLPATRNRGILEAKSNLISFLDADDEWKPQFLQTIIQMYNRYPGAGIYATSYEDCINGRVKGHSISSLSSNFEGYLPSYFRIAPEHPFCSICVGIPKYIFESIGYFNENSRMCEDIEMWTKIAIQYPVVYSKKILARYYHDDANQMTTTYYPMETNPVKEYISYMSKTGFPEYTDSKSLYRYMDFVNFETGLFTLGSGNMKTTRNVLRSINERELILKSKIVIMITYLPNLIVRFGIFVMKKIIYTYRMFTWDKVT